MFGKNQGKIFGGIIGFALGGPLGAIIGAVAGNYVVDSQSALLNDDDSGQKYYDGESVFWAGVSVLAAKLSKADGSVSQDEVNVYVNYLKNKGVSDKVMTMCSDVFNKSKDNAYNFERYADDIADIYKYDKEVLGEIYLLLLQIANVDNYFHPAEQKMLHQIAYIFRFTQADIDRLLTLLKSNSGVNEDSLYQILGIAKDARVEDIKTAYRKLAKENHPDLLASRGVPQRVVDEAKDRMAKINDAYEKIMKAKAK